MKMKIETTNYERHQRRWAHDFRTLGRTWAFCPRNDYFYNPFEPRAKNPVYKKAMVDGEMRELVFRDENAFHDFQLNGGAML